MTRADSQPWQVRWPETKYSAYGTCRTFLMGSKFTSCSGVTSCSVAISAPLLTADAQSLLEPVYVRAVERSNGRPHCALRTSGLKGRLGPGRRALPDTDP